MTNAIKWAIAIAIPLMVGGISGGFTAEAIPNWYTTIQKPSFNPPNWLFGPVWTLLYILMGISLMLIWKELPSKDRTLALSVFWVQLLLNFFWSLIFFKLHAIGFALIEIIAMWVSILFMIICFYRIKPIAAFLNIPYLLWVSFATILNAAFYKLN